MYLCTHCHRINVRRLQSLQISCFALSPLTSTTRPEFDLYNYQITKMDNHSGNHSSMAYTPEQLYSPSLFSPRHDVVNQHIKIVEKASKAVLDDIRGDFNVPYGESRREKLDILGTDLPDGAPIFVFIHGGYWQTKELGRKSYAFIAENMHKNGIKSIFVGYELCPDVTMPEIIVSIERAAKQCIVYAREKGSSGVHFAGHSAGAHLVSYLFVNFIRELSVEEQKLIKNAFCICGIYDLTGLQQTSVNENLGMSIETAFEMSPFKQSICDGQGTKFYFYTAEKESPEFAKQAIEFSQKLGVLGVDSTYKEIESDCVDHFNMIEDFQDEDFYVCDDVIKIILRS